MLSLSPLRFGQVIAHKLPPSEATDSNVRFKIFLDGPDQEHFSALTTPLKDRAYQGSNFGFLLAVTPKTAQIKIEGLRPSTHQGMTLQNPAMYRQCVELIRRLRQTRQLESEDLSLLQRSLVESLLNAYETAVLSAQSLQSGLLKGRKKRSGRV